MLKQPLIQIAGIIDRTEAELVLACGVRYLGFPLRLPVHQEDLPETEAAEIIRHLPGSAHAVLITYLEDAAEIAEFCKDFGAEIVQLHGDVTRAELQKLRTIAPELTLIKSLVVGLHDEQDLSKMVEDQSPFVEAFFTDTFDPVTGASGATGQTHDWEISRRLVELSPRPVILAGGLTPDNVRQAILRVKPAGVDAHTGVEEASGRKCRKKLMRFVREARAGFCETARF